MRPLPAGTQSAVMQLRFLHFLLHRHIFFLPIALVYACGLKSALVETVVSGRKRPNRGDSW
jgi:hypothetical protein